MKKACDRDIVLCELTSQSSLDLTEEDFSDIHSAIEFCAKKFPAAGAKQFKANLAKLDKKFWKFIKTASGIK